MSKIILSTEIVVETTLFIHENVTRSARNQEIILKTLFKKIYLITHSKNSLNYICTLLKLFFFYSCDVLQTFIAGHQ